MGNTLGQVLIRIGIDLGFLAVSANQVEKNPQVQFFEIEVDENQSLQNIVYELFEKQEISGNFTSHEAKQLIPYMSVYLPSNDLDFSTIFCNQTKNLQPIWLKYGSFGELYVFHIPETSPISMSLSEVEFVGARHFPGFNSKNIIVRFQGGFGAGVEEIISQISNWLVSETFSNVYELIITGFLGWVCKRKLLSQRNFPKRIKQAQIARDWYFRGIKQPADLRKWLDIEPTWKLNQVSVALVVPKSQAKKFLKKLGYLRLGISQEWHISNNPHAKSQRLFWLKHENSKTSWKDLSLPIP